MSNSQLFRKIEEIESWRRRFYESNQFAWELKDAGNLILHQNQLISEMRKEILRQEREIRELRERIPEESK